ncbi:MAG: lipoyl(octanoyl) transferase LipB [Candidatus Velthaea sp.]
MTAPRNVRLLDLGRAPYGAVWDLQKQLHAAVARDEEPQTWLVVEHEPVITLGRNARKSNMLLSPQVLAAKGIDVYEIERGGDVTYHGPGQVVVYPIVKLERFREIVPLVGKLEAAVIDALERFGIAASGRKEHRGVYVGDKAICAVGLAVQKMTTLHGLALNVTTELDYDRLITPCGTPEFGITSIASETNAGVTWEDGRDALLLGLERSFDVRFERESATAIPASAS